MKTIAPLRLAALACCVPFTLAHADIPEYAQTELQARSNLIVNDNGWNVPPGTSFNSISPAIDDDEVVTFTAGVVPIDGDLSHNGAGLWYGSHAKGDFVKIHDPGDDPEATMIISDTPSINASGQVAYYTSLDGGTYQLWKYDPAASESTTVSLLPISPSSIANPDITDSGLIGFKGRMGSGYGLIAAGIGNATLYAWDTNVQADSDYAYIYSPGTDNDGRIASKVSTSDYNHNEIRLFSADGSSALVVADQATDPASPFASFDNGLDINAADTIAVVVKLADGNARAVYRFDADGSGGYAATEIARVGTGPITDLPSFSPSINANGLVAFRAKDADGDAIYLGDGKSLKRIAGNGDVVETDLGTAQLGQNDDSPVFSGKPAINARGDIAFVAGVYPQGNNQEEWGSGVFVAYAQGEDDDTIFKDGFDSTAAPIDYAYDDGDGNTNQGPPSTFDPDMLWGNYFPVQPGGEVITQISVAFGPTFPSLTSGPVTFWLLEDSDADGSPLNAHALVHVDATPDVFNDDFFTVAIPPTLVHGAFFVGASAKLLGGQDRPARVDTDNSGANSWFFYAPDIAATIDDLASAPYHQTNDQTPVFPGAFMVRATGIAGP